MAIDTEPQMTARYPRPRDEVPSSAALSTTWATSGPGRRHRPRRPAVAILAAIVGSAFAIAGSGRQHTGRDDPARRRRAHPGRPRRRRADAGRRQGRRVREVRARRPDAAAGPGRRGQEVRRRRPPARHAGLEGPRADRGLDLRRQRQGLPRHRRASPPIVVNQGDTVEITFVNGASKAMNVTMPHSIDFHSAEVAPDKNYIDIAPARRCTIRSSPITPACSCTTAPRSRS